MRFLPNPRLAAQLADTDRARRVVGAAGRDIERRAKQTIRMTGYRRTLTTEVTDEGEAIARVGSPWPFAHLDEYGSINNSPGRHLTRAAEAAGMTVELAPKGTQP